MIPGYTRSGIIYYVLIFTARHIRVGAAVV